MAHQVSQRRACRVVGISDSVYKYRPDAQKDVPVIEALQKAVERSPKLLKSHLATRPLISCFVNVQDLTHAAE